MDGQRAGGTMTEPEPEAEPAPRAQPSDDGPVYLVKKWKVVGTWSWNFESGASQRTHFAVLTPRDVDFCLLCVLVCLLGAPRHVCDLP